MLPCLPHLKMKTPALILDDVVNTTAAVSKLENRTKVLITARTNCLLSHFLGEDCFSRAVTLSL